jgi:hypothetical protein
MISTQALTLLQLAVVVLGAVAYWLWPRAGRWIALVVLTLCYMATALVDVAHWRAYVDPPLFILALAFLAWLWSRVREARRH